MTSPVGRVCRVQRSTAAVTALYRLAGFDMPTAREEVRIVLAGIRNTVGRPPRKKVLAGDLVVKVSRKIGSGLAGLRDRAMLALCFGAARRRSEWMVLDVADGTVKPDGVAWVWCVLNFKGE